MLRLECEGGVLGRLANLGLTTGDIDLVVMTHLHFDHAGALREFAHATTIVTSDEWRAAHRTGGVLRGYVPAQWRGLRNLRLLDIAAGAPHDGFDHAVDLFGDGAVIALATPGESPGHISLLLKTSSRSILVCGDAAYSTKSIDEDLTPLFVANLADQRRSLATLRAYRRAHPDALMIPGHDLQTFTSLEPVYG